MILENGLLTIGKFDDLVLERKEVGLLLEFLSDQYISYENVPLIKLVREMREWYDKQS